MARRRTQARARGKGGGRPRYRWARWPRERLLDMRLCDLGLSVAGSWIEQPIERVCAELAARGLRFRPHFWLSDEWFTPDDVPGIAVPFYLAHPRLLRLERRQMLEVEGGTRATVMAVLRHEAGHALQNAFELHGLRRWQRVFGRASQPYPDVYRPNPASKRFVQHLDGWYAQSHPAEDFAETFAVWLTPRSDWRRRYEGWTALKKLEFVDALMQEIAGRRPKNRSRARTDEVSRLRKTLRQYYDEKSEYHAPGYSDGYDLELRRLFVSGADERNRPRAASFLRRHRREIRELVSRWTGEYEFALDQVLKEMIGRCRELNLRTAGGEDRLKLDFAIVLTMHTMSCMHRGRQWRRV